jgi:hypothetical protein
LKTNTQRFPADRLGLPVQGHLPVMPEQATTDVATADTEGVLLATELVLPEATQVEIGSGGPNRMGSRCRRPEAAPTL